MRSVSTSPQQVHEVNEKPVLESVVEKTIITRVYRQFVDEIVEKPVVEFRELPFVLVKQAPVQQTVIQEKPKLLQVNQPKQISNPYTNIATKRIKQEWLSSEKEEPPMIRRVVEKPTITVVYQPLITIQVERPHVETRERQITRIIYEEPVIKVRVEPLANMTEVEVKKLYKQLKF